MCASAAIQYIDYLKKEVSRLNTDVDNLRSENARLGGNSSIQEPKSPPSVNAFLTALSKTLSTEDEDSDEGGDSSSNK